jgi:ribosome biogenesis SPOUT family RNA methylase Rps3
MTSLNNPPAGKTFVVEHLDPELEEWSSLEYAAIASECHATGAQFLLSSVPESLKLPEKLQQAKGLSVEKRSVEDIYAAQKDRVCLLDPAASKDLAPEDGDAFDVFLFGGILGA